MIRRWFARLPWWRRTERDFDDEIASHIELEFDRLVAEGVPPAHARDQARRTFGNVGRAREHFFESRRWRWAQRLVQDVRYGVRAALRTPVFTATALLTLALGIGVDTALFSLLNSLVLRPLPLREAESLVNVYQQFSGQWGREVRGSASLMSYPEYARYRDHVGALEGLAAYAGRTGFSFGGEEPEVIQGQVASCNLFVVLRTRIVLGRGFGADDCRATGGAPVTVLSHALWTRRYGADTSVVGSVITVNRNLVTVIGVAEPGFAGSDLQPADAWFPVTMQFNLAHGDSIATRVDASWLVAIGRLRDDSTASRAAAQLSLVAQQNDADHPGRTTRVVVSPARYANQPELRGPSRLIGAGVIAAATLVVLLICLNLANLLLARASARRREIAIRLSLGADRSRVIAQLLTESVLLAMVGGAAGIVLAIVVPKVLTASMFEAGLLQLDTSPDVRVLGYAAGVSILAALTFGLAPALRVSRAGVVSALRGAPEARASRLGSGRLRRTLVSAQVAGSALLLVVAGLFFRSVARAARIDPGYAVDGIVWVSLNLRDLGYDAERARSAHAVIEERLRATPGVRGVASAGAIPLMSRWFGGVKLPGRSGPDSVLMVGNNRVSPSYFTVFHVPILRGRSFNSSDFTGGETPVVVSEAFAAILAPAGDAVGARFGADPERYVVVGVARDVQNASLSATDGPFMYIACDPSRQLNQQIAILFDGPPSAITAVVRDAAHTVDPAIIASVQSFAAALQRVIQPTRVVSWLSTSLGALALVLALIGIYGTVAYTVAQRTQEIGVRIALGARTWDVTALVLRDGVRVVLIGMLVGLTLGVGVAQLMRVALYGLSPLDPLAYAGMSAVIILSSLAAMWWPARRAARVQPMHALRSD